MGIADGTGSSARFYLPAALAVDGSGNVYVADSGNFEVRMITPAGVVSTLAGAANSMGNADGTGANARFYYPQGIAVDAAGDVYIADSDNDTLRKGVASGVPSIGTPPQTQSIGVGNAVTFTVAASSATQLTYQWSFNGKPIPGCDVLDLHDAAGATFESGALCRGGQQFSGHEHWRRVAYATFAHDATYSFNSWTASTILPAGTTYSAVAYDGSRFLAVGLDGTAFYSADGAGWYPSASNGPPGQVWGQLNSVINDPGQNMLVAVGNGGAVVTYSSGTYNGSLQASGTTNLLTGVTAGNGSLVAVGYGGTCIISNLAATSWTPESTGTVQNLNAVAFGNGTFVAVGLNGTVVTSGDGSKWSTQQINTTGNLYGIAYGDRGFVAVGDNGGIFTSPDGTLWLQQAAPTSAVLVRVVYGDGVFVAAGLSGTLLTSVDQGVTWTSQNSGTTARLDGVALGGNWFVLVGVGGVVVNSSAANPSRIIDLSARSTVGTGGNVLIAGFVIDGTGSKQILSRGVGPTLAQFGISRPFRSPTWLYLALAEARSRPTAPGVGEPPFRRPSPRSGLSRWRRTRQTQPCSRASGQAPIPPS